MQKIILIITLTLAGLSYSFCQTSTFTILETGRASNLRGLSSRDGKTIWVSGSGGFIGLSKDTGSSWSWLPPEGFASRDFRDIQDLGAGKAVTIGIDTPAVILKTTDGGRSWKTVYINKRPGMFLDALDFAGTQNGVVVGDPVNGHIFLARTTNGGDSWQPFTADFKDSIIWGEAFFAASGSNIHLKKNGNLLLVSGGAKSRLWQRKQKPALLPLQQGNPTAGPNGMDVKDNIIAVVGGDYTRPGAADSCYGISYDGGRHWQPYHKLPGYGSSVAIISGRVLVACGPTGVWMTKDGGKSWQTITTRPFNTLLYLSEVRKLFLAGPQGTIAVLGPL